MRLSTILKDGKEIAVIRNEGGQVTSLTDVNDFFEQSWTTTMFELIQSNQLSHFEKWWNELADENKERIPSIEDPDYRPLYRHPRKIWGIGLNYVDHASDLDEAAPKGEPASFMKPDTAIIGHGDKIKVPQQSERTTGEAELGVIIGRECKDVEAADAGNVVAGYTTIIDMTAEDILRKNPRYLTRAKSFDTFFSFGPEFITPDEIGDLLEVNVTTKINGKVHRTNKVRNMTFQPYELVSFHSKVMTLLPGDIISTGTPGAVVIRDGDKIECEVDRMMVLENSVVDLKNNEE
ncbi:fumarylacetoacetate hydrolase family protein [Halobacillus litoralis]|uniref:fumarylacetoacetate hydrolase family protein n=1 Tax=Halobacillus litoralis TaxID=45668 RepID=UPI00273E485F|nr:fumarylacetoacetate hydrolase family protein [Halobacillus litoralis]WLR49198.1 fumarylacetoacetate hydrolase family protein [Halobacillus litoralis]